ncbi:retrovirus-related pol polyprotein from transposon TNT 1-94 [Tanacetum coccineum]
MKAKLSLLEASPSSPQNPKTFQPKNKGLVAETFDWDEEEVSDEEEVTRVKVPMALADDELTVGKSHARNGEWVDITIRKVNTLLSMDEDVDWQNYLKDELLILKQAKLDAVTFQIQNTKLTKLNHALQEQLKEEKKINENWLTSSKKVERLNPDSKLPNFNTGRFLVPKSQTVNESLETSNTPESSKDSEAKLLTPLPPLKILQGASPSSEMLVDEKIISNQKTQESNSKIQKAESSKLVDSSKISQDSKPKVQSTGSSKSLRPKPIQMPQLKCELCHYTNHSTDDCYRILYCMICKREDHRTSDHEMYIASLKRSKNYKAQPYQYASPSKQILRAKAKPFPPCTHCGFNDLMPDDCNYPECGLYGSYDHSTSGHNHVIQIRGRVLAKSSQSNESSIGVKCNTCESTVHSTSNHNEFDHFKRETHQGAYLVPGQWMLKEYDWCQELSAQICRATSISQLCDAKYIVQFDDKQGTIFNANKEIVLIAPRRNDVYVLDMSSLTPNGACFFAKASESVNWLWHKRLSHLNFKNINKLAKQNKVLGLPSLVYSKDKPYTSCEKRKPHRDSFKTKQNFSIRKCLLILHMDLFRPVSPMFINHEKYTLVIVDEYSRYTWVYFLRKKSQAPEMIMSFIRMVENQNDVKVKQIRTDNGTEFRNHKLESFYDEKGISQNFSSPYTLEQNGVAKRRNGTLIEAARTMLNGLVLSKHF